MQVLSLRSVWLYPITCLRGGCVGPRAGLSASEKRKYLLLLAGIGTRFLVFPNCRPNTKANTLSYSGRNLRKMRQNIFVYFTVPSRKLRSGTEGEKKVYGNNHLGHKTTPSSCQFKCDGTHAEIRFRLSAKRTSPFKLAGGRQFSRLLAAELCASAVVMLDTPCSEVV